MTNTLEERDWDLLLRRIWDRKCTPFLGAGACYGTLPLGADIARAWAQKHGYPLQDSGDLARVAQFLAVKYDVMYPKEEILKEFFAGVKPPTFTDPDEPHGVLADLPLPVYMTTNYDDFMTGALESRFKDSSASSVDGTRAQNGAIGFRRRSEVHADPGESSRVSSARA